MCSNNSKRWEQIWDGCLASLVCDEDCYWLSSGISDAKSTGKDGACRKLVISKWMSKKESKRDSHSLPGKGGKCCFSLSSWTFPRFPDFFVVFISKKLIWILLVSPSLRMCGHVNWIPVYWALQGFETSQHPEPSFWPSFFQHLFKVFLQWNESFPLWQDAVCWFDSCSHGSSGIMSAQNLEWGFCCCQPSRILEEYFLHTSAFTLSTVLDYGRKTCFAFPG